jgi:hypothetical protein
MTNEKDNPYLELGLLIAAWAAVIYLNYVVFFRN